MDSSLFFPLRALSLRMLNTGILAVWNHLATVSVVMVVSLEAVSFNY